MLSGDAQGRGDGPCDERVAQLRGRVEANRREAIERKKSRKRERAEGWPEEGPGGSDGKKEAAGGHEAQGGRRRAVAAAGEVRKGKPTLGFGHLVSYVGQDNDLNSQIVLLLQIRLYYRTEIRDGLLRFGQGSLLFINSLSCCIQLLL